MYLFSFTFCKLHRNKRASFFLLKVKKSERGEEKYPACRREDTLLELEDEKNHDPARRGTLGRAFRPFDVEAGKITKLVSGKGKGRGGREGESGG